jgi:hypothetical protein
MRVYMERNREADKLSKEGTHLAHGKWKITKFKEGSNFEYYHQPFIETGGHEGLGSRR